MPAVGQLRLPTATMQTAIVSSATLAAAAAMGLVLAYWTWTWFGPRAEAAAPPAEAAVKALPAAANGLFGVAPRDAAAPVPSSGVAIRLLGVVAASTRGDGYAVVQLEPRRILAVREGEEVAPGVSIAEVHADHIVLNRGGMRETLAWPLKNNPAESPPPPTGK